MKTKLQSLSVFFKTGLVFIVNLYLFATCTTELDKADRTPVSEAESGNRREVLLSFKNKLTVKTTQTETKTDAPIATEAENGIATLDVYVFGAKAEGDAYTFRERFSYRQDGSALPAGAKELNLAQGADNATTTALLELQKGLFVRLYCIANQTELMNPVGDNPVTDTYFAPLTYDMETGVLTDGIPTELQFQKFHSPLLTDASPALGLPLPMTGAQTTPIDLTDFGSLARVQVGFKLSRTMARFDVSNIETESKFHLESISMGNGRRGTTFFPVKVYGAATAADGELITYPTRAFEGDKANTGLQVSAFYSYPSLSEDKGYLILSGTYQVNQTETKEVSYQIPFKQQTADGGTVELAINANHRYTIGITKADEYHLDFTLDVAEWEEGGSIDDYDPNAAGGAGEITITVPDPFKDETQYDKDTRTVSMSLKAGSKFYMETQSIATLTLQKKYVGGISAQQYDWLEISEPETSLVPKTGQTGYKYTVTLKDGYDKTRFPRAVVRLTNIIDASETALVIEAESSPHVVEVRQDAGNWNTFDLDLLTASLYRVTGSKVKVNISCPDGSTVASLPDWLEAKAVETNASVIMYELSLKDRDVEVTGNEGEVVFQNAKDNTKNTAITVKLLDASIAANFDALGGTGNTYDAPHDAVLGNINMPLSSWNNFTVSTTSLDGVKIKMDFGMGPAWLSHNGEAASARAGDVPNTIKFSLATDKAGEGKAEPATITLQNVSGGTDYQFTVTPSYQAPSLTTPASVTLRAEANNDIPSITITGTSPGGTTLEGPAWLTYPETSAVTDNFSYTVNLDLANSGVPASIPANQTIKLINKTEPDKSTTVTVSFTEANAWVADDLNSDEYSASNGYRVRAEGKTMTVSFYGMFVAPTLSTSYDGSYCNSQNGGNTWLNNAKLAKTEVVNNRRKYTFNVVVNGASGTDAAYQLHRAIMNIKHNGKTVKSYVIWRGVSYYGYPAGGGSSYYTAIRKNGKWWAPVNCGASRVAIANDGKNGTVAGTGNLYQWGRYEATNFGGPVANGPTGSTRPGNNTFYKNPKNPFNWLNTQNNSLWNGSSKGTNDPCPAGYRVPTDTELASIGNATEWLDENKGGLFIVDAESGYPRLILPAAGFRSSYGGSSLGQGSLGYYWSSSVPSGSTSARYMRLSSATFSQTSDDRAGGFSVRCIRQ